MKFNYFLFLILAGPPYTLYFGIKFYADDPCKLKEEITRYSIYIAYEPYVYGPYKRLYLKRIEVKHLDVCLPAFCNALL